jgi:hypothetical protein
MSAPTRDPDRLQLDEVERLRDVAEDLAADRDPDGVLYTSRRSREAARAFVAALQEEPTQTLRELTQALRQARIDAREDRLTVREDGRT